MYGATRKTTFFLVEAPILLRLSLPALLTIQIAMLHATLLGSFIGVDEILKVTGRINAIEYQPIELYTILAAIFVLLCIPLTIVAGWLARKYRIAGV
jgi:ABC-type amino acid transport system permease subunit